MLALMTTMVIMIGRGLMGIAWLLAAVALVAVVAGERLVGSGATAAMDRLGYPDARVRVAYMDLHGAVATVDLGTAAGEGVERAVLRYSPAGLMRGRLDALEIHGATVGVRVGGDGDVRIAGLGLEGGTAADRPLGRLPLGDVVVTDSLVRLDTPAGGQRLPIEARVRFTPDGAVARVMVPGEPLDIAALEPWIGSGIAGRVAGEGVIEVRFDGDALTVVPDGCVRVAVSDLAVTGRRVTLPDGVCVTAAADSPLMTLATAGNRAPEVAARLSVAEAVLPDAGLVGRGIDVALRHGADGFAAEFRVMVADTGKSARFAPLAVTARADRRPGAPIRFEGEAAAGAVARITGTGRHDPDTGAGALDLRVPPVSFKESGPQLASVVPAVAGIADPQAGTLAATGRIAWTRTGLDSGGEILLDGVGGLVGPVTVAGVNGVVRLSSLSPLVIPAGQTLAVALLDVGVPLTEGEIAFGRDDGGRLSVQRAQWQWAGGTVRAEPFTLRAGSTDTTAGLLAEGVDLGRLLDLVAVDGLAATGRLDGRIPVRVRDGTVRIEDGTLRAQGPGTISYDPADPPSFLDGDPGSATDLLRGALTDFRYTGLVLMVDGTAGGELGVRLTIEGANPQFYDGYPVKLNLNVSGALDRILRRSLDAYRIPDAIRDRMMEFGRSTR